MAITRRETKLGRRFDVEWRLPDRSKRCKSFKTKREARVFEAAIVTKSVSGDVVDPLEPRFADGQSARSITSRSRRGSTSWYNRASARERCGGFTRC
jgi:hypothetical protein